MLSMGSSAWRRRHESTKCRKGKPCHSYRRDDAVGGYGYKTSPGVSCYRVRLVSAANNANGDGTFAEARFVQIGCVDEGWLKVAVRRLEE